jgi:hypothetical protein
MTTSQPQTFNEENQMTHQPLDHGILNIPLSKRGDIDAQIDRYNAEQEREARAKHRQHVAALRDLRTEAKELVANVPDSIVKSIAAKARITPSKVRSNLKSDAHWTPDRIIRILRPKANA